MKRDIPLWEENYDVVVIGGGLAGICAAVAAAREGRQTVLVQNRPVLGGNSSAEIGVPPHGADQAGSYRHVRETGIIGEIAAANAAFPNYLDSPSIWSVVLWDFCRREPNLTVHLNTHAGEVEMEGNRIVAVSAEQQTTEKRFRFTGRIFIDCSGDGILGYRAGADFMTGREGKDVYGEPMAHPQSDDYRMGNSVYMRAREVDQPVPFDTPDWVHIFPDDASFPDGGRTTPHPIEHLTKPRGGWWWIETGGRLDAISDAETIRDELYRYALGVWDHLKNRGDHGAENYVLESIVTMPGKRDSRRFYGDYVLVQRDVEGGRIFDDAVAYGGWHIDVHQPDGVAGKVYWKGRLLKGIYTIPYRCLYSRNIENLFLAGRNISASHIAFASARVMLTCAVMGQAAGTAAGLCLDHRCTPREIYSRHLRELQGRLIEQDCYLPGVVDHGKGNLAPAAEVSASSTRALRAPTAEKYQPLEIDRGQMFVLSESRLDSLSLPLENRADKPIRLRVTLRAGQRIDDFRSETDLGSAEATIPPGKHLVEFVFQQELPGGNRPYWVFLPATPHLAWGYSRDEEPGTQAACRKNQYFTDPGTEMLMHRERGTYGFEAQPPSRCFGARQVVSGVARPESASNEWISGEGLPQWIQLRWESPVNLDAIHITFDNGLDRTLAQWSKGGQSETLVRDYTVVFLADGEVRERLEIRNNQKRKVIHQLDIASVTAVRIEVTATWGENSARIFEIRAMEKRAS
jgi:hypothetical protein